MHPVFILFFGVVVALPPLLLWLYFRRLARAEFIRNFRFPPGVFDKLAQRRPGLTAKDQQLVARGLRQFFLAYLNGGRRFVSMPSQVADDLWHEFILYTRLYQQFCGKAFGKFLHHTPAVVLGSSRHDNEGLRRVWWHCCRDENINPRSPTRLPLLFALDAKLGIADGFVYAPDCRRLERRGDSSGGSVHCASDFGDSSFDGDTAGFEDTNAGDSGCGGGCGGGD